jgi:hypothetical protein
MVFKKSRRDDDHSGHVRQDICTGRVSHMTQTGQYKWIQEQEKHDITIGVVMNVCLGVTFDIVWTNISAG